MARVRVFENRDGLSESQLEAYEQIEASRGSMPPPFAPLLHVPEVAKATADLGAAIRFSGQLSDRVRELAICVTAHEKSCDFEWSVHSKMALDAGVSKATLDSVESGGPVDEASDAVIVDCVRELCRQGEVSDPVFTAARDELGEARVVELVALAGYYTLISYVMGALEVG